MPRNFLGLGHSTADNSVARLSLHQCGFVEKSLDINTFPIEDNAFQRRMADRDTLC